MRGHVQLHTRRHPFTHTHTDPHTQTHTHQTHTNIHTHTVADPGFPRDGANSQSGCANLLFYFEAEKCIKMKKFGSRARAHPLDPPMVSVASKMDMCLLKI